jgi:adenosylhomocysteine nucleosidase
MRASGFISSAAAVILLVFASHSLAASEKAPAPVTGLLGAFSDEVNLLTSELSDTSSQNILGMRFFTGTLKGRKVVVASSGVGKVNAAMTATLLIEHFQPSEVLFSGIAGALNPGLDLGDIVIAEKTAQHDLGTWSDAGIQRYGVRNPIDWERNPTFVAADARLLGAAEASSKRIELDKVQIGDRERQPKVTRGIVVSGDVFVASSAKKEELHKNLNADAVEMEGAAVAQVCLQLGIPCLVIRSISDTSDANARVDSLLFYPVAARNSARLVAEIVAYLALQSIPKKQK